MHSTKSLLSAFSEIDTVKGDKAEPPALLPVSVAAIPGTLKALRQWVVWEADWIEDSDLPCEHRLRKIPVDPVTKERWTPGDLREGTSFEMAWTAYRDENYAGIGFLLTENDPFAVVQIGDALSGDGLPRIEAVRALRTLSTYAEKSPDGLGLTLILRGHLPPGGYRRETMELSESERFIPITGCHLPDSPAEIEDRQAEIEGYHSELFPSPPKRFAPAANTSGISDEEMLRTAFHASNGLRIQQLYRGDSSIIPGGRDAADLALCSMLGFFTGNDPDRLDRLFRQSSLFRPKWDTVKYSTGRTYGQATVAKALEGCLVFHTYPVHPVQSAQGMRPPMDAFADRPGKRRKGKEEISEAATVAAPAPIFGMPSEDSPAFGEGSSAGLLLPVSTSDTVNPIVFAEQMGRAEGLAQRETVLNAKEAAHLLKISPKLLRRTIKPWRRFGGSPAGDRWLLSDLLSKI